MPEVLENADQTDEQGEVLNATITEALGWDEATTQKDGIIENVKVLGFTSKNGREYTQKAASEAKGLYENANVYVNHSKEPRKADEHFGRLHNVREAPDGLRADLSYLTSHPLVERLREDVDRKLGFFGLSHSVDGKVRKNNGKEVVEAITRVKSVDLVTDPATCKSLTEQNDMDQVKITALEEQIKSLVDTVKVLQEKVKSPWAKPVATDAPAIINEQISATKLPTTPEDGRKFMRSKQNHD